MAQKCLHVSNQGFSLCRKGFLMETTPYFLSHLMSPLPHRPLHVSIDRFCQRFCVLQKRAVELVTLECLSPQLRDARIGHLIIEVEIGGFSDTRILEGFSLFSGFLLFLIHHQSLTPFLLESANRGSLFDEPFNPFVFGTMLQSGIRSKTSMRPTTPCGV